MKSEKSQRTKNILKGVGIVSAIAGVGYILYEYNQNLKDYNELVEKTKKLSDFINDHDFYIREDVKKEILKKQPDANPESTSRFIKNTYENDDGKIVEEKVDKVSGFKVISVKEKGYDKIEEKSKEL